MHQPQQRAFTLVEILIVVIILGILAAIVVPQFARASDTAAENATLNELQKLRRHIGVFRVRNDSRLPSVEEGDGTWGEMVSADHFLAPPVNAWVGGANSRVIVFGIQPDAVYQTEHAWIYDPASGNVWAGGFDANDRPYPR